jgi:hypothetical protein
MGWNRPPLCVERILDWADAHYARTGEYPRPNSGPVVDAVGENWASLNNALYCGFRGLPGGDSLPRLLVRHGRRPALWAKSGARGWTATEDALVRKLPPAEAARQTGRQLKEVYRRRSKLGLRNARGRC